jgi:hypothetical protein
VDLSDTRGAGSMHENPTGFAGRVLIPFPYGTLLLEVQTLHTISTIHSPSLARLQDKALL